MIVRRTSTAGIPPGEPQAAVRAWTRIDTILLLAIIAAGVVIQLWLLKPPAFGDQLDYFYAASSLPDVSPSHRHLRIGLLLPVWLAIQLFGYAETAYYFIPFLGFLGLAASTYLVGKRVRGTPTAFLGCFLISFNPYILWESSHLLPDVFATACLTFSIVLVLLAAQKNGPWSRSSTSFLLFLAGFVVGWSYLVREFTLILFPLLAFLAWTYRIRWRGLLLLGAGAFAAFGLELAWGAWVYDDPLLRVHILSSRGTSWEPGPGSPRIEMDALRIVFQLPILFLQRDWGTFHVLVFAFSLAGGLFYTIKKDKGLAFLFAWLCTCLIFFTMIGLMPVLLERPLLRMHKFRYWLPILPPLYVLGSATLLAALVHIIPLRGARLRPQMAFSVVVIATALTSYQGLRAIGHSKSYIKNGADHYHEFRAFLQADSDQWTGIWVDKGKGKSMSLVTPMYLRSFVGREIWHGELRYLTDDEDPLLSAEASSSDLVLVNKEVNAWKARRGVLPEYLAMPPLHWKPVFSSSNNVIYAFSGRAEETLEPLYKVSSAQWSVIVAKGSLEDGVTDRLTADSLVVEVRDGQRAYVMDHRGRGFGSPTSEYAVIVGGHDLVRGTLEVNFDGSRPGRDFRIACFFYAANDGNRHRVWARHSGATDIEGRLAFLCAPPAQDKEYDLRVVADLVGPSSIKLGAAEVFLH